jgi:N-methylhydantoinase A
MSNGVRQVSLAKGYDPRDFALTAFGGAGAIHAGALVESLGIHTILVPKNTAPMLCALGDLLSDLRVSRVRSFYARGSAVDLPGLNEQFRRMRAEAEEALGTQRSRLQAVNTQLALEMRYVGQTHEVTVPVPRHDGSVNAADVSATIHGFHILHKQLYTFNKPEDDVEILSVQLDLIGVRTKPVLQTSPRRGADPQAAYKGKRPVYSPPAQDYVDTHVYDGDRIVAGDVVEGPAVIEEKATSIVIFPGQRATLNEHLTYVIEVP